MPLTTPPVASAPLYARNKLTGQTYLVGPPASMIDDLGDVDTSTTGPTGGQALIWNDTLGQWVPGEASTVAGIDDLTDVDTSTTPPTDEQALVWDEVAQQWVPADVGIKYWDPVVNYIANDMVLWPETAPGTLWKAFVDNVGEEPVPSTTKPATGVVFPGAAGGLGCGIGATAANVLSVGFQVLIQTDGTIGTGTLLACGPGGNPYFRVQTGAAGYLQIVLFTGVGFTSDRALADFPSLNHIKIVVTGGTLNWFSSADGVTWTEVPGLTTNPVGLGTGEILWVQLANDGTGDTAQNYAGIIRAAEIYNADGTVPFTSWVRATQPDALGVGNSAKTGELYSIYDPLALITDDPPPGTPSSWLEYIASGTVGAIDDLSDVDTSTVPPAPGDGLIWDGTNWVPGPGGSEVEVADVEPTANVAWELWADLSDPTPTDPLVLGMGMNDLTDADTVSTPPVAGNTLLWSGAQWMPGTASTVGAIDDLTDVDTTTTPPAVGEGLAWDGTNWIPSFAGGAAYSEVAAVAAFPATLTIVHALNADMVSVTVAAVGPPKVVVVADVTIVDADTVSITLASGAVGDYEVLVLAQGSLTTTTAMSLDDLSDVDTSTRDVPAKGDVLTFDDVDQQWYPKPPAVLLLDHLLDVDTATAAPAVGDTLQFDGTNWVPVAGATPTPPATYQVSWMNSWSGECEFRVNDSSVTLRLRNVKRSVVTDENTWTQLCALPAGVPAPWADLKLTNVQTTWSAAIYQVCQLEIRSTGLWVFAYDNRGLGVDHEFSDVITWTL